MYFLILKHPKKHYPLCVYMNWEISVVAQLLVVLLSLGVSSLELISVLLDIFVEDKQLRWDNLCIF
jgi:hypothetical protein